MYMILKNKIKCHILLDSLRKQTENNHALRCTHVRYVHAKSSCSF